MHERRTFFSESTHERETRFAQSRESHILKERKKRKKKSKKKIIIRVLADLLYTTILLRN